MQSARPEDYNPPLTRWGHLWRLALCILISGIAWAELARHQWTDHPGLFWLDLAGGVASYVLVQYRRRWPFAVALAIAFLGLISVSSAGPACLATVSLATRRRIPELVVVSVVGAVAGQVFNTYQPYQNDDPYWVNLTLLVVISVAIVAVGMYLGSRRELLWTLRERARQAESEQELRIEQARSAERERIAREMHDVLAHRISLVTMHAGALAYRTDLPPDQIRETAGVIQAKAQEALTDLRSVLGVLRGDADGGRPQPTLGDLGALLTESRESGMVVELDDRLDGVPAEQVGRTLYRVVQEGLTNARKHAPGAHVSVRLEGAVEDGVTVTLRNARPVGPRPAVQVPRSGLGLVGLRERAALAGGNLSVEDTADGFRLRGWFPWTT